MNTRTTVQLKLVSYDIEVDHAWSH